MKTITTTIGIALASLMTSGSANADEYDHMDRIAVGIQAQAREMLTEAEHFRHTSQYRHLKSDLIDLYRSAQHVHEVAHVRGSLRHLENDVRKLDRVFHHVEGLIEQIEHDARYGHGHVHGSTGHLRRDLRRMATNIHHLQEDIRDLRRASHYDDHGHGGVIYYNYGGSGYGGSFQSGGYGHRSNHGVRYNQNVGDRGGLTIGRGNVQFSVGF